MANTASFSAESIDVDSAYAQSFGVLKNKTRYVDAVNSVDKRSSLNENYNAGLKAHSTTSGGAGTAGYAMIPVSVDQRIIDQSRKLTPLTEIIPRVTNRGMYADYNVIVSKGGAFTALEDGELIETDTVFDRKSTAIKFLYAVGRVTGPSKAAQPSYILQGMTGTGVTGPFTDQTGENSKQLAVLVKARELKELEENLILNGNATTSAISGNPNGSEFDGIITLQGTVNKVDKNTTALSLGDIDTAIQYAFDDGGRPNVAVCSSAVFTDLQGLLNQRVGYMQSVETVMWGFTSIVLNTAVGKVPVIQSMFMSNTSGSKAMYFLDLSVVEMRVLQDMTYEELAHVNDSDKFMLKMYETLIIKNTAFNSFIGEIA